MVHAFDGQYEVGLTDWAADLTSKQTTTVTHFGLCHTFHSAGIVKKNGEIYTTRPGKKYGLLLQINANQNDYLFGNSVASGVQVKLLKIPCQMSLCKSPHNRTHS